MKKNININSCKKFYLALIICIATGILLGLIISGYKLP